MNTFVKSSSRKTNFFHRIDARFPWLKLIAVCVIGVIIILDLLDFTISKVKDPYDQIKVAPMSHHPRVTKRILKGKKLIALTFDDGPSSVTTPNLLDVLYKEDVPATFFAIGKMAQDHPDIIRRAESEGHIVASHTMYHQNFIHISTAAIQADIDETNAVFRSILGHLPAFVRPPYGNINDAVRSSVGAPIVLWSVDTLDWKDKSTDSILATTMSEIRDGAIILMHDIYPTSVEAVPILINTLREAGYEFVTIPELAKKRGIKLINGIAYYNFPP